MALEKPTYRLIHDSIPLNGSFTKFRQIGRHSGVSGSVLMTQVKHWYTDQLVGLTIHNDTDVSSATITSNTNNTIETNVPLSWDDEDQYRIDDVEIRSGVYRLRYDGGSMDYDAVGSYQVHRSDAALSSSSSSSTSSDEYEPGPESIHEGFKIISGGDVINCPGSYAIYGTVESCEVASLNVNSVDLNGGTSSSSSDGASAGADGYEEIADYIDFVHGGGPIEICLSLSDYSGIVAGGTGGPRFSLTRLTNTVINENRIGFDYSSDGIAHEFSGTDRNILFNIHRSTNDSPSTIDSMTYEFTNNSGSTKNFKLYYGTTRLQDSSVDIDKDVINTGTFTSSIDSFIGDDEHDFIIVHVTDVSSPSGTGLGGGSYTIKIGAPDIDSPDPLPAEDNSAYPDKGNPSQSTMNVQPVGVQAYWDVNSSQSTQKEDIIKWDIYLRDRLDGSHTAVGAPSSSILIDENLNYQIDDGIHDGVDDADALTDGGKGWTEDELVGSIIHNIGTDSTDENSWGIITANTSEEVTAVLTGNGAGPDWNWDIGDRYRIYRNLIGKVITNETDKAADLALPSPTYGDFAGTITSNLTNENGDSLITAALSDGQWHQGDEYSIGIDWSLVGSTNNGTDTNFILPDLLPQAGYQWKAIPFSSSSNVSDTDELIWSFDTIQEGTDGYCRDHRVIDKDLPSPDEFNVSVVWSLFPFTRGTLDEPPTEGINEGDRWLISGDASSSSSGSSFNPWFGHSGQHAVWESSDWIFEEVDNNLFDDKIMSFGIYYRLDSRTAETKSWNFISIGINNFVPYVNGQIEYSQDFNLLDLPEWPSILSRVRAMNVLTNRPPTIELGSSSSAAGDDYSGIEDVLQFKVVAFEQGFLRNESCGVMFPESQNPATSARNIHHYSTKTQIYINLDGSNISQETTAVKWKKFDEMNNVWVSDTTDPAGLSAADTSTPAIIPLGSDGLVDPSRLTVDNNRRFINRAPSVWAAFRNNPGDSYGGGLARFDYYNGTIEDWWQEDGPESVSGGITGTHDGGNGLAFLSDSTQSWDVNSLGALTIHNDTDVSSATITANDATTVTGTLSSSGVWDTGDTYRIVTDGHRCRLGESPIASGDTAGARGISIDYETGSVYAGGHIDPNSGSGTEDILQVFHRRDMNGDVPTNAVNYKMPSDPGVATVYTAGFADGKVNSNYGATQDQFGNIWTLFRSGSGAAGGINSINNDGYGRSWLLSNITETNAAITNPTGSDGENTLPSHEPYNLTTDTYGAIWVTGWDFSDTSTTTLGSLIRIVPTEDGEIDDIQLFKISMSKPHTGIVCDLADQNRIFHVWTAGYTDEKINRITYQKDEINNTVVKLSESRMSCTSFGSPSGWRPHGVAVDADNNIWVAPVNDTGAIKIYQKTGGSNWGDGMFTQGGLARYPTNYEHQVYDQWDTGNWADDYTVVKNHPVGAGDPFTSKIDEVITNPSYRFIAYDQLTLNRIFPEFSTTLNYQDGVYGKYFTQSTDTHPVTLPEMYIYSDFTGQVMKIYSTQSPLFEKEIDYKAIWKRTS